MTANLTLTYGSLNLTATPYLIEFGMDTGAPQNVYDVQAFMLQDGEVALSSRASNRTLQFNVLIEGASLSAMATAEAALVAETEKPLSTITVDPGDGAPAAVYETFRGQVTLARDDGGEIARLRRYTVTVQAGPFVRSAAETVTAALAASGTTTTLVNDGSATTGWTGTANGSAVSPSVVSGAVKVTNGSAVYGTYTMSATLTASVTTSSTKYIVVDWKTDSPLGLEPLRAFGDGTELSRAAETQSPTAGLTRTWFGPVAASSIAVLRFDSLSVVAGAPLPSTQRSLYVDNVNRTDVKPTLGSARQLVRQIAVGGSARGQASLAIEHATSSLGDVLAYFYPDSSAVGYVPSLRQYRNSAASSSTATTDATMVSGARDAIGGFTFAADVPVSRLSPGLHLVMVRLSNTGASSIAWAAHTYVNGILQDGLASTTTTVPSAASQTIFALGRVVLPTTDVDPGSSAVVRVSFNGTSSAPVLDEAWLFNTEIGQLVWVACGTSAPSSGGSANRVFIEPASITQPRPSVRIGFAADRSDSFYPVNGTKAWQAPILQPPLVNVHTVTTNALDASVTLRGFNHWHTNPGS